MSKSHFAAIAWLLCMGVSSVMAEDGPPDFKNDPAVRISQVAAPNVLTGNGYHIVQDSLDTLAWRNAVQSIQKQRAGKAAYTLLRVVLADPKGAVAVNAHGSKLQKLGENNAAAGRHQLSATNGTFIVVEHVASPSRRDNRDPIVFDGFGYGTQALWVDVPPGDQLAVLGDVVLHPREEKQAEVVIQAQSFSGEEISRVVLIGGPHDKTFVFDNPNNLKVALDRGSYKVFFPEFDLRNQNSSIWVAPEYRTRVTCTAMTPTMIRVMTRNEMISPPAASANLLTATTDAVRRALTAPQKHTTWGSVKGRFLYDGKAPEAKKLDTGAAKLDVADERVVVGPAGGLANVVVYLRTKNMPVHPDYKKTAADEISLTIRNGRLEPHVALLRTTQTLKVTNASPMGVNLSVNGIVNAGQNPLIKAGESNRMKFTSGETLPIALVSNVQPWLKGYLVIRGDPYMAVSDKNGAFTIQNLPAGVEVELQCWHETTGYLANIPFARGATDTKGRLKLTLKPAETDLGDFKVPPALFTK